MSPRPDFALGQAPYLEQRDLLFLFEHFPVAGIDPVAAAQQVIEHPNTLESMLDSQFVYDALRDKRRLWLDISPKLFFNVLLRRCLPGTRSRLKGRTIHYLANLLGTFSHCDRLHRVQAGESQTYHYLCDLIEAESRSDPKRSFLVHSQIGNYALFLSGVCAAWVEFRHEFKRRPVDLNYYRQMGASYFAKAAGHKLAEAYAVHDVLQHLADEFEYFRRGLDGMARQYLLN